MMTAASAMVMPRIGGAAATPDRHVPPAGVGLRPQHYEDVLETTGAISFVEVHAENYFCAGGPQHHFLNRIREKLPLSLHGVGLSLGGAARPDRHHLDCLRKLIDRYQPFRFSEHLAWSSHGGRYFNDLLPLPYTIATLNRLVDHVSEAQEVLGRPILIENPSLYLAFEETEMSEPEFLAALAKRSGCGLLLDLNNLYVSAVNAGADPWASLAAFPLEPVGEIHLAGHTRTADSDGGPMLIDTHDAPVADAVWQLYAETVRRAPAVPVLIEWDSALPSWQVLVTEAQSAQQVARSAVEPERHAIIA